jgi:hypothetical protein
MPYIGRPLMVMDGDDGVEVLLVKNAEFRSLVWN